MLKVNGQAYVTNLKEVSPRLITGTVYSFEKVGEEFKTTFIKAKFIGEAITYLITNNVKEKDKVFIKSGVIKSNTWTNKEGKENSQIELTIFELDTIQNKEVETKEVNRFKRWTSSEVLYLSDTPFE